MAAAAAAAATAAAEEAAPTNWTASRCQCLWQHLQQRRRPRRADLGDAHSRPQPPIRNTRRRFARVFRSFFEDMSRLYCERDALSARVGLPTGRWLKADQREDHTVTNTATTLYTRAVDLSPTRIESAPRIILWKLSTVWRVLSRRVAHERHVMR